MMMKPLIPLLAGLAITSLAVAQQPQTAQPKLDDGKPHMIIKRIEQCIGGGGSYLGVQPSDITEQKSAELGMAEPYGALLDEVLDNTPAKSAGLQKNDVIVSWNGTRVESAAQLRRMVAETPAGRTVNIGYLRNGARLDAQAKVADRPAPKMEEFSWSSDSSMPMNMMQMGLPEGMPDIEAMIGSDVMKHCPKGCKQMRIMINGNGNGRMGTMLQNVTPELAKQYGVAEGTGALVGSVVDNSPAKEAGIQAGDVIIRIDGKNVTSPMDARKAIMEKAEGPVSVTVIRDKAEQTFTVTLKKAPEGGPNGAPMRFNAMPPHNGTFEMRVEMNGEPEIEMLEDNGQDGEQMAPPANGNTDKPELGGMARPNHPAPRIMRFGGPAAEMPPPPPSIGI